MESFQFLKNLWESKAKLDPSTLKFNQYSVPWANSHLTSNHSNKEGVFTKMEDEITPQHNSNKKAIKLKEMYGTNSKKHKNSAINTNTNTTVNKKHINGHQSSLKKKLVGDTHWSNTLPKDISHHLHPTPKLVSCHIIDDYTENGCNNHKNDCYPPKNLKNSNDEKNCFPQTFNCINGNMITSQNGMESPEKDSKSSSLKCVQNATNQEIGQHRKIKNTMYIYPTHSHSRSITVNENKGTTMNYPISSTIKLTTLSQNDLAKPKEPVKSVFYPSLNNNNDNVPKSQCYNNTLSRSMHEDYGYVKKQHRSPDMKLIDPNKYLVTTADMIDKKICNPDHTTNVLKQERNNYNNNGNGIDNNRRSISFHGDDSNYDQTFNAKLISNEHKYPDGTERFVAERDGTLSDKSTPSTYSNVSLASTPKTTISYPMASKDVMKLLKHQLSAYERKEISKYNEIWYLGHTLDTTLKQLLPLNHSSCCTHLGASLDSGYDEREYTGIYMDETNFYVKANTTTKNNNSNTRKGSHQGIHNHECENVSPSYTDKDGLYKIVVGDHIAYQYEIVDIIGQGSFSQVIKAFDHKEQQYVALKIIRNKKRFHQQALTEIKLLKHLQGYEDLDQTVKMVDHFYFRKHLCIQFELLGPSLYDMLKKSNFRGFRLNLVRDVTKSLIHCLHTLRRHRIIHCDFKPENILIKPRTNFEVKLIDFGSSCYESEQIYTYIQSRFYRSPEVILGTKHYTTAIDMWSLGCVIAELYTGSPLYPGQDERDQMACFVEILGKPNSSYQKMNASSTKNNNPSNDATNTNPLKTFRDDCERWNEFFDSKNNLRYPKHRYGSHIMYPRNLTSVLKCDDHLFIDFLYRCFKWDPRERITPREALKHPWITGQSPEQSLKPQAKLGEKTQQSIHICDGSKNHNSNTNISNHNNYYDTGSTACYSSCTLPSPRKRAVVSYKTLAKYEDSFKKKPIAALPPKQYTSSINGGINNKQSLYRGASISSNLNEVDSRHKYNVNPIVPPMSCVVERRNNNPYKKIEEKYKGLITTPNGVTTKYMSLGKKCFDDEKLMNDSFRPEPGFNYGTCAKSKFNKYFSPKKPAQNSLLYTSCYDINLDNGCNSSYYPTKKSDTNGLSLLKTKTKLNNYMPILYYGNKNKSNNPENNHYLTHYDNNNNINRNENKNNDKNSITASSTFNFRDRLNALSCKLQHLDTSCNGTAYRYNLIGNKNY